MEFTQEVIGAESYLVYHLKKEDVVDSFLKGMLQNNEIQGILKPSFSQKDMERYIKYGVTSKIPLSEWMARRLKKEKVLTLFASIISAIEDAEEYMITVDKLLLDPVHIYIDVSSMKAFLICLPLEGSGQEKQGTDLLKEILFGSTYEEWEDLNYVGRIIDYLNKNKNGPTKKLLQFLKDLSGSNDMPAVSTPAVPQKTPHDPYQEISPQSNIHHTVDQPEGCTSTPTLTAQKMPAIPPISSIPPVSPAKTIEPPQDEPVMKKRISLFGNGKEQKQTGHPNRICVPGMDIPGMDGSDENLQERSGPADGLAGQSVAEGPKRKKKKEERFGLFRGKKKEDPVSPELTSPTFSTAGYGDRGSDSSAPPSAGYPVKVSKIDMVMAGSGESMDDEEGTIIMGGGMDEERTQFLDSMSEDPKGKADMGHIVATLTRRRNNQRITLMKPVIHIGKESSFADLYIGDNPAISSAHADIVLSNGTYYIRDMNSLNHTYVNRTMIIPNQLVPLRSGDVIKLANEDFDFVIGS